MNCRKCCGKTTRRRAGVFFCQHCGMQPGQSRFDRFGNAPPKEIEDIEIMTDYSKLPTHMQDTARLYVEKGIRGGSFFTAVVCGDLFEAFKRADDINSARMKDWVTFFYWEAPRGCWGSEDHHDEWVKAGGLHGIEGKTASPLSDAEPAEVGLK